MINEAPRRASRPFSRGTETTILPSRNPSLEKNLLTKPNNQLSILPKPIAYKQKLNSKINWQRVLSHVNVFQSVSKLCFKYLKVEVEMEIKVELEVYFVIKLQN